MNSSEEIHFTPRPLLLPSHSAVGVEYTGQGTKPDSPPSPPSMQDQVGGGKEVELEEGKRRGRRGSFPPHFPVPPPPPPPVQAQALVVRRPKQVSGIGSFLPPPSPRCCLPAFGHLSSRAPCSLELASPLRRSSSQRSSSWWPRSSSSSPPSLARVSLSTNAAGFICGKKWWMCSEIASCNIYLSRRIIDSICTVFVNGRKGC